MIESDRNHPCIISWRLCNEVGGQNPPAYEFAQRLYPDAKKLEKDPLKIVFDVVRPTGFSAYTHLWQA